MEKLCIPSGMDMPCAELKRGFSVPIYKLILLVSLICFFEEGKAQSPLDANLSMIGGAANFDVLLPDTTNISEIELQIGSSSNSAEYFSHVFSYDQSSGLPSGLTYTRDGASVALGLGTLSISNVYVVKTRLKNSSGSWGDWYEFVGN